MNSPFVADAFAPVAWRVHWREAQAKLTGLEPRRAAMDFPTRDAAEAFKAELLARQPHAAACVEPQHLSRKGRSAKTDARQMDAAASWPLQHAPPKPKRKPSKVAKR